MNKIKWKTEIWDIKKLKTSKYNPRKNLHGKRRKDLERSLKKFALAAPIVINKDGTIIGGHQRYFILKERGEKKVAVSVPSRKLTQVEEKELNLRLNKNIGSWDFDLLSGFDKDFLQGIGFDNKELDKIFSREKLLEEEVTLKPYKKTHVLISFPPEKLPEIQEALLRIKNTPGIDYEATSN